MDTRARVGRYTATGLRTSLLSVPGAVGAAAAGFTPVGEVMGCAVEHAPGGVDGLVTGLRHGYATALARLREEAAALGADGVLGIACTVARTGAGISESTTLGTAVRATAGHRPRRVFTTCLPGPDVAKLVRAGWVPVAVAIGIAGGTVFDAAMADQVPALAPNQEVSAPTELVTRIRAGARAEFAHAIADPGADGGLVSETTLRAWRIGTTGAAGVASIFGTAIGRCRPEPTGSALPVISLRDS